MPIYAYRCAGCGFEKDVLQKISDAALVLCPECNTESFVKQVTAAGFQLKGSGWYVTDFKGGNKPATESGKDASAESKTDSKPDSKSNSKPETAASPAAPATGSSATSSEASPATSTPAKPAPASS